MPLDAEIRRSIWARLPAFDLQAALAGTPYIHRSDVHVDVARSNRYSDVRELEEPHGGYLVWCGEWLPYTDSEVGDMFVHLRMFNAAAWSAL